MMRVSVFQWVWCVVVLLFVVGSDVGVAVDRNGVLSSTVLTGSTFYIPDYNRTSNDAQGQVILLVTNQTDGVLLNGPELQVVANTTVYFSLSAVWSTSSGLMDSVSFGLTRSNVALAGHAADPLGLTPTPASLAALSCTTDTPMTNFYQDNTWGLNWTLVNQTQVFSTTPCVVQWAVPPYNASANATKYYYFNPLNPSAPRQINIVDGPASSPSGTGTGTSTGTGSGNNNNNSSTTTGPPTTPTPSGTSSLSPTSSSSSSTGSNVPATALPSVRVSVWAALVAVLATVSAAAAC